MKKYWIAAVMAGFAGGVILVWQAIAAPVRIAARNLAAINSLSAGKTTEAELLSRKAFQAAARTCFQENCFYHMEVENFFLNKLHLAPRTFIGTSVGVRNGVVTDISVFTMRTGLRPVTIRLLENLPGDCHSDPCLKLPPANPHAGIRIVVGNQSDVRNRMPEVVNVQCLAERHGCMHYAEFVPLMRELPSVETSAGMRLQRHN